MSQAIKAAAILSILFIVAACSQPEPAPAPMIEPEPAFTKY